MPEAGPGVMIRGVKLGSTVVDDMEGNEEEEAVAAPDSGLTGGIAVGRRGGSAVGLYCSGIGALRTGKTGGKLAGLGFGPKFGILTSVPLPCPNLRLRG